MIVGIGTDLVEVERITKILSRRPGFAEKVFTAHEIDYCLSRKSNSEHFAARFAVKEALFKAMGTGWVGTMQFSDVEVYNESSGKPALRCCGKVKEMLDNLQVSSVFISLSHTSKLATATVVLEK